MAPGIDHLADQRPPVKVHVEAWAEPIAQRLHEALGDYVALIVGVLRYPQAELTHPGSPRNDLVDADPAIVSVTADGQLAVPSGRTLRTKVRLTNRGVQPLALTLQSDRTLYGVVVDPRSGQTVNGDMRWAPLTADVSAKIAPGSSVRLDVRVPTASASPSLGYAIPPGEWQVRFRLPLTGASRYSAPLRLRVVTDATNT